MPCVMCTCLWPRWLTVGMACVGAPGWLCPALGCAQVMRQSVTSQSFTACAVLAQVIMTPPILQVIGT